MAGGLHQVLALTDEYSTADELAAALAILKSAQSAFDSATTKHDSAASKLTLSNMMTQEPGLDVTAPNLLLLKEVVKDYYVNRILIKIREILHNKFNKDKVTFDRIKELIEAGFMPSSDSRGLTIRNIKRIGSRAELGVLNEGQEATTFEVIIYKENHYSGDENIQFIVRVNFGSDTTKEPYVFTAENIDVYVVRESRLP